MLQTLKHAVRDRPLLRAGALRAGALVRSLDRAPPGIYTLCYHHVPGQDRDNFKSQLDYLRGFGRFISADAAVEALLSGRGGEGRSFVLTFDDGYRDNVEVALPVIRQQGVPAVLFLVSDWVDRPPEDGEAYLSRQDIARWLEAGLEIGSHGASHRRFSGLSDMDARDEIARAAATLAALTGGGIRHFACPWGVPGHDFLPDRDPALAGEAGHQTFFTTSRGRGLQAQDLMAMPRHVLEPQWPLHELDVLMGGSRFARR